MTDKLADDSEGDGDVEFRRLMKTIGENLVSGDVAALKFLCQDVVPSAKLEPMKHGLQLLVELERKEKLGPGKYEFLAELFLHIGRLDLIRKLGIELRAFKATVQKLGPQVNSFRLLLQEWADGLTKGDLEEVKFLVEAHLPRRADLEQARSAHEVFLVLEKNQVITAQDVNLLLDLARTLDRKQLLQKTYHFQAGLPSLPAATPTYTQASPMLGNVATPITKPIGHNDQAMPTKIQLSNRYSYTPSIPNDTPTARPVDLPISTLPNSGPAYQQLNDDLPCYKMDAKPRGLCVIINNRDFYHIPDDKTSRGMPAREGTEVDRNNLEYMFKKLQFNVVIHNNLTEMQMIKLLQRCAVDQDHSDYDCFTCCILTHGIKEKLYGVNGRLVEIKDLTNFYKASTCPTLRGKPKLFFIQACQGKMKQIGVDLETDAPNTPQEHGMEGGLDVNMETLPNEADFLMGYATLPGFVSYRSKTQGSWYITTLVQMLDRYSDKNDLLSIMIKVNEEVSKATAQMKDASLYKQSPAPVPTLRKKIFFF